MKRPIIMDCDPGIDDALAILLALASDKLDVKLITTCAGNQTPEKTLTNALKILSFLGRTDIEVAQGAPKPLYRDLIIADYAHGETGLGVADLGEATMEKSKRSAMEAMKSVIEESQENVAIVATGPLTNVAIFLTAYPELKSKIERISLMGGACFGGNITPAAEFNIYVDPEAAELVFQSGVPIVMCGLDVTHKAQMFQEDIERIRSIGNKTGEVFASMLDFYAQVVTTPFLAEAGHVEGLHMHDPCAVAYVIDPTMFRAIPLHVAVETTGKLTAGSTVVDYNGVTGKPKNADVVFEIDRERFVNMLYAAFTQYV